jgi:hypothetical protein
LSSVFEDILVDMLKMKERSPLVRVFQVQKDPGTIAGFRQKLSDALTRSMVCYNFGFMKPHIHVSFQGSWVDKYTTKAGR